MSTFFAILKKFSNYHDKTPPLSITKVLFRGFGCKVQNKAALQKTLTRFWTANSVKYENVIIGAIKNATRLTWNSGEEKTKVGKEGVLSL